MVDSIRFATQHKPVGRATLPLNHLGGKINRAKALQRKLERIPGIESAFVSLFTEMVYIIYDPQQINLETLRQRLEQLDLPED